MSPNIGFSTCCFNAAPRLNCDGNTWFNCSEGAIKLMPRDPTYATSINVFPANSRCTSKCQLWNFGVRSAGSTNVMLCPSSVAKPRELPIAGINPEGKGLLSRLTIVRPPSRDGTHGVSFEYPSEVTDPTTGI